MGLIRGNISEKGGRKMPKVKVGGKVKHFPYTKAGRKAAAKAKKK